LRRSATTLLVVGGAFIVLTGIYVAARGYFALRSLQHARSDVTALQAALQPDQPRAAADAAAAKLGRDAHSVARLKSDPVWRIWQHAPVVGSTFRAAPAVGSGLEVLARDVAPTLIDEVAIIPRLRQPDGRIDVKLLGAQGPRIQDASNRLDDVTARLARIERSEFSAVARVQNELDRRLTRAQRQLHGITVASAVGPPMLGGSEPRTYLLVVQNNAEARATGGIVGAYGLLEAQNGKLSLKKVGPDTDLRPASRPVYSGDEDFAHRYARLGTTTDWREATLTPSFPTAATILLGLWADTHKGQRLDGVLSVDPIALSRVLEATGPIQTPAGARLTAANAVAYTLSTAYAQFPDKAARSEVLTDAARAVVGRLTQGAGPTAKLTERLGSAAISHHLYLYSATSSEQRQIAGTDVSGVLADAPGPQLMVVTQDTGGSKLSYYLHRRIEYAGEIGPALVDIGDGRGPEAQEFARITVTLTNAAPANGLPVYVTQRVDLPGLVAKPVGQTQVWVSVYLSRGGQLSRASLDGQAIPLSSDTDASLAVFSTTMTIDPGAQRVLTLDVAQPTTGAAPLIYRQQPLVTADDVHISRKVDTIDLPWVIR
jgi:hypothetical protein